MSSQVKIKYEKKFKKDPLWDVAKAVRKVLELGIKEGTLVRVAIELRNKEGIVKELADLKKNMHDVPVWDKDICLKTDLSDNQYSNTWIIEISLRPLEDCDPKVFIEEVKRLQAYYRKLLKDELWIKEIPQDGGDSQ